MDIQKYVTTNEDGTVSIDQKAFQSELDAEVSRAVEKFKNGKGKEEIRKQLEEEAKLSAEEKLKQEREEFEQYKVKATIELNQAKARARMEGRGFTDKEVNFILSTVTDNETDSLSKIDELVKEREQVIENTKKLAIEGLQQGQQTAKNVFKNPDNNDAPKATRKTADEIIGLYRPQDNN